VPALDAFDVLTTGRIGVDLYPLQVGVSLREVSSFGKFLGALKVDSSGCTRYRGVHNRHRPPALSTP
jgi:hypothetical protein